MELRSLGRAEIETDISTLTPSQEIVFASALYLAVEKGKRVSRSGLAELLWPDVEVSTRAHRLRQTLLQLKKLGVPVSADKDTISLSSGTVRADFAELESLNQGTLPDCQSLEFLPGYSPRFSEPFRDWVDTQRSAVHSSSSRMLLAAVRRERGKANWIGVEHSARRVLEVDPFNEVAVLALAEASAMRGQKRGAVKMLDQYLQDVGGNADIRLPAIVLRKRILDTQASISSQSLPDSLFVGREAEMETLTKVLKEAQKGRGNACLIVGEPGIGKSRLAAELAKFAELQGFRTQNVSCQRSGVDRPLSVLIDLVPALRDMPGAIGCSQDTLLALRRLTELDTRPVEMSASTAEPQALQRAVRHALFDMLDAIADEVPLLLLFDDVQWIDPTSADVISALIAWGKTKRLLFVLNSRNSAAEIIDLFGRTSIEKIDLNALAQDAARTLLTSLIGDRVPDSDPGQSRWILNVGEGNPFFLQELAKHWLESGNSANAPSSVSKVLNDRISRLDPRSLTVLQACTILGQRSTVERVEAVLEYPSHELLAAIQNLSGAGMLTCSADSAGLSPLSLRARHDLVANAVLERTGSHARAFLHRRAGIVLERELSGDRMSAAVLWACAFHWHHSGDRDRALSVARSCAEHLLEVGLPQDASEVLARALEYCSCDEQRILLLARQVDALQMAGKWEQSKEILHTCRRLRLRLTPACGQHDAFELLLVEACRRTNLNVFELLSETMICVECGDASSEHRIQAAVIALKLATDLGAPAVETVYSKAKQLFEETECNNVSRMEAEMIYHSTCGDGIKGLAAARALVQLARQSGDPARLTKSLISASNSSRINGTVREAEDYLRELIDCSLKHHFLEMATVGMQNMARLALSDGDVSLACEMLERSKHLPVDSENLRLTAEQHVIEARLALQEGNITEATTAFSNIRKASFAHNPSRTALYLALEIRIRVLKGEAAEILRPLVSELETAHMKLRTMGLHDFETESLFLGLRAIGEESRGQRLVFEYLESHRREHRPPLPSLASVVTMRTE